MRREEQKQQQYKQNIHLNNVIGVNVGKCIPPPTIAISPFSFIIKNHDDGDYSDDDGDDDEEEKRDC